MIRELVHDDASLTLVSTEATLLDLQVALDLIDTITYHKETCVGMAANMIGFNKRIIVFDNKGKYTVMFNPTIVSKQGEYKTLETCLSYMGGPTECIRHKRIEVKYQDMNFKWKKEKFSDFTAEIIEHEVDHLNGVLI